MNNVIPFRSGMGDAGSHSDYEYTGDDGSSALSMQYYRNKAAEFQVTLNQVDEAARAAQNAIDADIDPSLTSDLLVMLQDFDMRKSTFRATAEGINAGASIVNSMGGRFPELSIPSGLGLVPFLIPAASIAALGVAASLVVWGSQWVGGVVDRMKYAQVSAQITDPAKREALAIETQRATLAQEATSATGLSDIAGVVKWGAIAALAFLLFREFGPGKRR